MKERIIGAAVLVLFVVLVVPIFLDGPPAAPETVSQPVLLPGQEEQKTQTVVLDRNRTEPVPVPSSTAPNRDSPASQPAPTVKKEEAQAPPAVETKPAPAVSKPEPSKPEAKDPPTAVSETGMWAVQLGSFSDKSNAEKLAASLRKQGYAAFLSQLGTATGPLHRVRIGPQKDREGADAMAARLQKAGHKGQVVPHP
ncbi:MAG: hypothetical protein HKN64_04100 [Woeseiaceae bacterium]|nr:hypothetical protein [Woeseiaceae bacterium]